MQRPPLFPTLGAAFGITFLAILSTFVVGTVVGLLGGPRALGEALGLVVGFGGVGTLAARQVPPPQAERLGLRGVRLRFLLPLLLLIPVSLLASELDNTVKAIFSQAQGSSLGEVKSAGVLEVLEVAIVAIGIQPVVSEWLYRGVVQQGLVSQLGPSYGIVITALLYALGFVPEAVGTSFVFWLAATLNEFVNGVAYGLIRHYSGSLLAPILLHIALNASASLALAFSARVPIPGFNAAGAHTPVEFLMPAAASVALGIVLMVRFAGRPRPLLQQETSQGKGQSAPPH
jgi:membrane protease YdiL (CAAX protease family)